MMIRTPVNCHKASPLTGCSPRVRHRLKLQPRCPVRTSALQGSCTKASATHISHQQLALFKCILKARSKFLTGGKNGRVISTVRIKKRFSLVKLKVHIKYMYPLTVFRDTCHHRTRQREHSVRSSEMELRPRSPTNPLDDVSLQEFLLLPPTNCGSNQILSLECHCVSQITLPAICLA